MSLSIDSRQISMEYVMDITASYLLLYHIPRLILDQKLCNTAICNLKDIIDCIKQVLANKG